ncbi:uncharacterized protein BDZ99DRAFT_381756 [Mytilinidion resinicola]|uniref:Alpha/beta hydrolase fold-3 domain-containing protein n=1 Tax=Mytilinidion resinicola TaxID=574789 RepID=A0A6A6YX16_9PEZI|nr:uncharacterized protein BDZ99DRAFT_381756 [Mytilinidion resinicola]KAF2812943.1 hypothetical protein BDZ99DRAFT_381756 [Mytilinidion resinicola]
MLRLRALLIRPLIVILSFFERRLSSAGQFAAAKPKFTLSIPSTIAQTPHKIPLLFYGPKTFSPRNPASPSPQSAGFPVVINFHGGGFTIGAPNNDARWATAAGAAGAVLIGVKYRLAPEHPHPAGIEDGVDAILWVRAHGAAHGLDASRIVLSGSSAGGNLSLTVALRLFDELRKKGETVSSAAAALAGIVAFYPSTNYAQTRAERRRSNTSRTRPAKQTIPDSLFRLFDESYLYPHEKLDLTSPFLSPGLAPAQTLRDALPARVAIFTCEWDQLYAEGEAFRKRLVELGKQVGGRMIEGVDHGWDKAPTFMRQDTKKDAMYAEAAAQLLEMFGDG